LRWTDLPTVVCGIQNAVALFFLTNGFLKIFVWSNRYSGYCSCLKLAAVPNDPDDRRDTAAGVQSGRIKNITAARSSIGRLRSLYFANG